MRLLLLAATSLLFAGPAAAAYDPPGLFLTWQRDPTTTMTIDWHALADAPREPVLEYRALGGADWTEARGASQPFPHCDRTIHRVELTGLDPATVYEFRPGADARVFRFRTMPATIDQPLRVAVGGDVRHSQAMMEKTNRVAMRHAPDFIVWGGDLAYANSDPRHVDRWHEFFTAIKNTLIDADGRVVPIVVAIGNHEVFWRPRYTGDEAHLPDLWGYANHDAAFFYDLFAFPPRPGIGALDFGKYLSLIILNTDHGMAIPGEQTRWLRNALRARRGQAHVIPVYHVPAYPSVRDFDGWASPEVREHWAPLFERHGVRVAFEHHDHAYKRTHPIRNGRVDERGIVYLGDGAWGVETRQAHDPAETWYLARAASVRHFILMTLQGTHQHFLVLDEDGNMLDSYPEGASACP